MFVRLLHGAVALSLASEPAADAPAPDAVDDSASTADAPAEPESDPPAEADAPAADAPEADASEADAPATDAPAADASEADAPAGGASEAGAPAADAPEANAPATEAPDSDGPTEATDASATAPPAATAAPRPMHGPAPSGRDNDIVRKALLGGGIASLTLTAGLIGTSAWAWTEHNRAKRAVPNLADQARVDAQDRQSQMRTIGAVTTAAAVLYGTTGVVLLLLNARDRKQAPRTVLAPTPRGLSLVGRF